MLWNGLTVDATSVLVKFTYAGDANLDGVINIDDYSAIDGSVAAGGLKGWAFIRKGQERARVRISQGRCRSITQGPGE